MIRNDGHSDLKALLAQAREARERLGLSYSELSRRTGIGTNQIAIVMAGRRNATFGTLQTILRQFGLELCVKRIEGGGDGAG